MGPATIVVVLFCFWMGITALARPQFLVGLYGIVADGPDARNEVRAVYGGYGIALGCLLLWASQVPNIRTGVYLAVAVSFGGMALGRLLSLTRERAGKWPLISLGGELFLAGLLLLEIERTGW